MITLGSERVKLRKIMQALHVLEWNYVQYEKESPLTGAGAMPKKKGISFPLKVSCHLLYHSRQGRKLAPSAGSLSHMLVQALHSQDNALMEV